MKSDQNHLLIPPYLQPYIVDQDYDAYTSREHAVWRFIMRVAKSFFAEHAHPVYLDGLSQTGIPVERIPRITEMDEKLSKFGWRAVCVRGFIPPLAFLEFQANRILPIAADMRTLEHLVYTPAPDIVHEAAGHAPILADEGFRNYLTSYANIARKAIFSKSDVKLYEAIRMLSDAKENPDAPAGMIAEAEDNLDRVSESITDLSEAGQISRMYWWTAEYGLVGSLDKPFIYGAGLLSSIGEGRDCLDTHVEKRPLSLQCTEQSYDITEPQPQLFVARDFNHLNDALHEFESKMAFMVGGLSSIEKAQHAEAITTVCFDSGLEVSGLLKDFESHNEEATFLRWEGPVQLCFQETQLQGQGRERHPGGFSTPIGHWVGIETKVPSQLSDDELRSIGLRLNSPAVLSFTSGFKVEGTVKGTTRTKDGTLLLITWTDCTVTKDGETYFQPDWGEFDMAVGVNVPSVFGGPSDWLAYGDHDFGRPATQPGRTTPFTVKEKQLFSHYKKLRDIRETKVKFESVDSISSSLRSIIEQAQKLHSDEWLLALEVLEICRSLQLSPDSHPWINDLDKMLSSKRIDTKLKRFIDIGRDLARHQGIQ